MKILSLLEVFVLEVGSLQLGWGRVGFGCGVRVRGVGFGV